MVKVGRQASRINLHTHKHILPSSNTIRPHNVRFSKVVGNDDSSNCIVVLLFAQMVEEANIFSFSYIKI